MFASKTSTGAIAKKHYRFAQSRPRKASTEPESVSLALRSAAQKPLIPSSRQAETLADLKAGVRSGLPITLVLGAGVSYEYGVPNWNSLVEQMWKAEYLQGRPLPKSFSTGLQPIALEALYFASRKKHGHSTHFWNRMRNVIYQSDDAKMITAADLAGRKENSTLAVVSHHIARSYLKGRKGMIRRVLTFNADDLLERAVECQVQRLMPGAKGRATYSITRPTQHPLSKLVQESNMSDPRRLSLPVYHLHGYLPLAKAESLQHKSDSLVFTDFQYWKTTISPLSAVNTVISSALHTGPCIFIGLSMTDLNLLRWLATRAIELHRDKASDYSSWDKQKKNQSSYLKGHIWIREESKPDDSTSEVLSEVLTHRGVDTITTTWGNGFRELMDELLSGK